MIFWSNYLTLLSPGVKAPSLFPVTLLTVVLPYIPLTIVQALIPRRAAGRRVKRETQELGSSSAAMDGGAVTRGGGTGTGNMTGSTESCPWRRGRACE